MPTPARFIALASIATLSASALAQQIEIPFDMSISDVEVVLTLQGQSDTDTSPITGSITIDADDLNNPATFAVLDLQINATETINHSLSFGILGNFTQSTSGLAVAYAFPGVPSLPAMVVANAYAIPSLDTLVAGTGTYNASGLVCAGLQGAGLPCSDTIALDGSAVAAQNITGSLTVAGNMITIDAQIDVSVLLDPTDPALGMIDVSGFATGTAMIPASVCPGDCDGSGAVDFNDLVTMLGAFGTSPFGVGCDPDTSGVINFGDLVAALGLFGPCP